MQEEVFQNAEVDALYRLAATGVRVPQPHICFEGVLLIDLVSDGEGNVAPRLNDVALNEELALVKLCDEGVSDNKITVSRFKGLGEMNPDQLWVTTLCPDTRRLVPFQASRDTIKEMNTTFTLLMGKRKAAGRRAWMEKDGGLVEADV